jgi:TRAP transporter TAXI family solute receptor
MMRGELKFGYAASDGAYEAFSGTGKFAGNPYRGLRTIWLASDLPFAWIVRKDSGITQLEGLNGKPFNTGIAGGVTPAISEAVLNMFGVKAITHATSTTDAIAQMKDRRVVGWVKAGMHPSAEILELQADMAINILSFTEQQYEKIHERFIFLGYSKLPDGIYKGVKGFNTYSITAGAFVDATISADLVYKIIKAMHEGWPEFVKSFPQFTYLDLITNTLSTPVPLHAGVVKYFRQLRKEVPQGLIPQEYKD